MPERRKLQRDEKVDFTLYGETSSFRSRAVDATKACARFSPDEEQRLRSAETAVARLGDKARLLQDLEVEVRRVPGADPEERWCLLRYRSNQLPIGHVLQGKRAKYRIAKFLGEGQSAETYLAVELPSDTEAEEVVVVVKIPIFLPDLPLDRLLNLVSRLETLFRIEMATLHLLTAAPCAAHILDDGDYTYSQTHHIDARFMVQQYVDGDRLDLYLEREHARDGEFTGLTEAEFFPLALALAKGLGEVHANLVIHGDIWPENIMIANAGHGSTEREPKFIDFGQAAFRDAISKFTDIPGRNSRYVAPEPRSVSTDIYALGGVLFYLATGDDPPPFEQLPPDVEDLKSDISDRIKLKNRAVLEQNRGVADIIARCLRRSDQRVAHTQGVIEDLETFFPGREQPALLEAAINLAREAEQVDLTQHPLFRWMASLRAGSLTAMLKDMQKGVYDLFGDHEDIVSGLTQYVSFLGSGDEYLTITTPRFWLPRNVGINGRFLAMNAIAAQRGASVRRLFLECESDRSLGDLTKIRTAQLWIDRELKAEVLKGSYEVRVRTLPDEERTRMLQEREHFGLLVGQHHPIAIFPEYRSDDSLAAIRFRAGREIVGELRGKFESQWNLADPIESAWSDVLPPSDNPESS